MSFPYERTSADTPNAAGLPVEIPGQTRCGEAEETRGTGYDCAQLGARIGVGAPVLAGWLREAARPGGRGEQLTAVDGGELFKAADVVWFEALARLVRSGVPVARAAVLLRTAQDQAADPARCGGSLPKPRLRG